MMLMVTIYVCYSSTSSDNPSVEGGSHQTLISNLPGPEEISQRSLPRKKFSEILIKIQNFKKKPIYLFIKGLGLPHAKEYSSKLEFCKP